MIQLRPAGEADLHHLARMNRRLIEDENNPNPMSFEALTERMRDWLATGEWTVELIEQDAAPLGYIVYRHRANEYFPDRPTVYIRQFYIERERRRRGFGRQAFDLLVRTRLPASCEITLDVHSWNETGQRFWTELGFQPYSISMKFVAG